MEEIRIYFEYAKYLESNENYSKVLTEIKMQVDYFMLHYNDDPRFLSGWSHAYFCDDDGGRILFDIERPDYHECSICGKIYSSFQMDSCYTTMLRTEAFINAEKAALIYQTCGKEARYLDIVKQIIGYYAENYDRFPLHAKHVITQDKTIDVAGTGKIMPQGLNEAVAAIRMISAMEIVKSELDFEWVDFVKKNLFDKIYGLLKPQKKSIHNIPCWINSALGIMGLFFNESEWTHEAISGEYNLYEQLEKGVTSDGFWYEGSIHYNFYTLEGITYFFAFAKAYNYEVSDFARNIVKYMFDAAYKYAFDNDMFPNPSDGWPGISLGTYLHTYYLAYKAFGSRMAKYLTHIENGPLERNPLPLGEPFYYNNKIPMEKLLFAPHIGQYAGETQLEKNSKSEKMLEERSSLSFEKYNCAILRNDIYNVFFKYGHQTASHAHPDKMNIEIMMGGEMFSKDLSNSGYASRLCIEWHKTNMSHNTCMVDGIKTDIFKPGRLLHFDGNKVIAESNPYKGVIFRRSIELKDNLLVDDFMVECANEDNRDSDKDAGRIARIQSGAHRIEWFFHLEEPVDRDSLILVPTKVFKNPYFLEPYEIGKNEDNILNIDCKDAHMRIRFLEDTKAYLCSTYNNPANRLRDTIILRTIGSRARFLNEITYIKP